MTAARAFVLAENEALRDGVVYLLTVDERSSAALSAHLLSIVCSSHPSCVEILLNSYEGIAEEAARYDGGWGKTDREKKQTRRDMCAIYCIFSKSLGASDVEYWFNF